MIHVEQWARVRARTNCQLRRGAWYRVVEFAPLEVVLEVNRQPLRVPRPFLQILPIRPRLWSVVARLRNAAAPPPSWGPRYGVCPRRANRAALPDRPISIRRPALEVGAVLRWFDALLRVVASPVPTTLPTPYAVNPVGGH